MDRVDRRMGLAVSAIVANVAEVAAIYLFKFLGLDDLAENVLAKVCSDRSSSSR